MTTRHNGAPVDELDQTCREYKNCLSCVAKEHGRSCMAESVDYSYGKTNGLLGRSLTCLNAPGCERSICECDKAFAEAHAAKALEWDLVMIKTYFQ